MNEILIAIGVLGGLGLLFGLVLAIASKVFYVETDPRLDLLNECLPGANCGGCGYAGCGGYAEAVLKGEAEIGKCASGGNECAMKMAEIMGVKAEKMERRVAMVRCSGYKGVDEEGNPIGAKLKGEYEGISDCLAASKVAGRGPSACKFGCLGFGNCVAACQYGAISVKAMNRCMSIGVAISIGLALMRVLLHVPIYWIIIPGYLIALLMSLFVPKIFVGIAFDSGGVASGPMTSTFLLPLSIGTCRAVGGNLMTDAFGVVALVALTPLIAIQVMGVAYKLKTAKLQKMYAVHPGITADCDRIVDLEEEGTV